MKFFMSMHLNSLERFCNKLQLRYGVDDPLCRQIAVDVEVRRKFELKCVKRSNGGASYPALTKRFSAEHAAKAVIEER